VAPIRNPTILICSHRSRDSRCGVLGPLLRDEFAKYLSSKNVPVETGHFCCNRRITEAGPFRPEFPINIGLISHVGGHKWAGNVIVYIPSDWGTTWQSRHLTAGSLSKVAGMGVWYGRVEPKHVEGIVEETLFKGSVIKELFRGAIGHNGRMLRIWRRCKPTTVLITINHDAARQLTRGSSVAMFFLLHSNYTVLGRSTSSMAFLWYYLRHPMSYRESLLCLQARASDQDITSQQ